MNDFSSSLHSRLTRIQRTLCLIGLVALGFLVAGGWYRPSQFFFSYLFGSVFWLGLTLGCFCVSMIHQLTGGRWGYPTRRFLEAGFMTMPLMLLLFVPVFLGLRYLYPWAQPAASAEPLFQQRHAYMNPAGYIIRAVAFFAIWIWISRYLRKWSLEQDVTTDAAPTRKARTLSGPGVVLYSFLGTFAFVDWLMSLEPRWHSTMFAVIVLIGQILLAFAFSVIMLTLFRKRDPIAKVVTPTHYHHLGNLLLTFVLFWTYISFGQLLIVYSGDLPSELDWYLHRIAGNWKWVISGLAVFHFFVPFFLLLFRTIKRSIGALTILAGLIFVAHAIDAYWLVLPTLHPTGPSVSWMDLTAFIGIGGIWLGFFLARLKGASLVPQHDPGLQFAFNYGH